MNRVTSRQHESMNTLMNVFHPPLIMSNCSSHILLSFHKVVQCFYNEPGPQINNVLLSAHQILQLEKMNLDIANDPTSGFAHVKLQPASISKSALAVSFWYDNTHGIFDRDNDMHAPC